MSGKPGGYVGQVVDGVDGVERGLSLTGEQFFLRRDGSDLMSRGVPR
jgi:hypothetical protein